MRKMSKSRVEDDTVSSTNGSVKADAEVTNGGPGSDAEADPEDVTQNADEDAADNADGDSSSERGKQEKAQPRDPPKKRAAKSRAKEIKKEESDDDDEPEEEYEVEQVLDSRRSKGKLQYLIRWKGYSASSDTWEAADSVSCPDLIKKFEESDDKKSPKKSLKRKAAADTSSKKGKRGRPAKNAKKTKPSKTPKPKKEFDHESADADAEYEVERILEVHHKKSGKREFLIHWKGWSNRYDSWEPEEHLNCADLINKFMSKVSSARETEQRELRVAPETTRRFTLAQKSTGRRLSKRSNQRQRVRYDGAE